MLVERKTCRLSAALVVMATVTSLPATVLAGREFDAMADAFAFLGLLIIYVPLLLTVGLFCGIASRRKFPPQPWKWYAAVGCLVGLAAAVITVSIMTFSLATRNGPVDEAIVLILIVVAASIPSFLFAWLLFKRNRMEK